ncbi:hypothetical protein [Nocardia wallacei]|uniref:hypothetical protein n=1 Tax=Nocardia wallacei TaxID=480035 RepID=UPI002455F0D1|nr:hypothetical protein [Nocardia wallacei]
MAGAAGGAERRIHGDVGNAIGATVLGTIFFSTLGSASGTGDYVTAMQAAALAGLVVLAIVLAAAFTLPRRASH